MDDYNPWEDPDYKPWTEKEFFEAAPDATYADWLFNKRIEDFMLNPKKEKEPNWLEKMLFRFYISITEEYQNFILDHFTTEDAQKISSIWVDLQQLKPFKNKYLNLVVQGIVLRSKLIFR